MTMGCFFAATAVSVVLFPLQNPQSTIVVGLSLLLALVFTLSFFVIL